MKCADCEFWKRKEDKKDGFCENDKFVYNLYTPIDGLMYFDYESFAAGFRTGESFGCIHFKEKATA